MTNVFSGWMRRVLRLTGVLALASLLLILLATLALRLWLLPQVTHYRPQINQALSAALDVPVHIGAVQAEWSGWRPFLALHDVRIGSADQTLLTLKSMRAWLGWDSLIDRRVNFNRLEMHAPRITLRRDGDGVIHVLGQRLDPTTPPADQQQWQRWLAAQGEIIVYGAQLDWRDEYSANGAAPVEIILSDVHMRLLGGQAPYRFGLQARLPQALGKTLDIRAQWSPPQYAHTDKLYLHASVAHWQALGRALRPWLPAELAEQVALDSGQGEITVRFDWQAQRLTQISSRFAVQNLALRYNGEHSAHAVQLQTAAVRGWLHWPPPVRNDADRFDWRGDIDIEQLALHSLDGKKILRGLSGQIGHREDGGHFDLRWHKGQIAWPNLLPNNDDRIALDTGNITGRWQALADSDGTTVFFDQLDLANADIKLHGEGELGLRADGQPWRARFKIAQRDAFALAAVRRYLPAQTPAQTRQWLSDCLLAGEGRDARIEFDGEFADFPFKNSDQGLFNISIQAHSTRLCPQTDWPELHSINGRVRFQSDSLLIDQAQGKIYNTALENVTVSIAELSADAPVLRVDGQAHGDTAEFIRFVANSPLRDKAGAIIDTLTTEGQAKLALSLGIVLEPNAPDEINGTVHLQDNRVFLAPEIPPLESLAGELRFDADSLQIPHIDAHWLGAPLQASAVGRGGSLRFDGQGGLQGEALANWLQTRCAPCAALAGELTGTTPFDFNGQIDADNNFNFSLNSELHQLSSHLPAPLHKTAAERWPLHIKLEEHDQSRHLTLDLSERGQGHLNWARKNPKSPLYLTNGALQWRDPSLQATTKKVKTKAKNSTGLMADLHLAGEFDFDAWRAILKNQQDDSHSTSVGDWQTPWQARLRAERFRILQNEGQALDLRLEARPQHWQGYVASSLAKGTFSWRKESAANSFLRARLKHFALDSAETKPDAHTSADGQKTAVVPEAIIPHHPVRNRLPAIDLVVDRFLWRNKLQGRLEIQARNEAHAWHLQHLVLLGEEGRFQAQGRWPEVLPSQSEITFTVDLKDLGAVLEQLNYEGVMDRGSAFASGHLSWPGSPVQFSTALLSGGFSFQAKNGQFVKIKPGAGRLLGLLSLQSLGRRLEGDFRDLIEDGFVFAKIGGDLRIEDGVMQSDNIHLEGASAQAWIGGKADLAEKTQDLVVIVQPSLSDSVTIGALATSLLNPAVGLVTYLTQKLLQNPLDKMFAFGYGVHGDWDNPQVEDLRSTPKKSKKNSSFSSSLLGSR